MMFHRLNQWIDNTWIRWYIASFLRNMCVITCKSIVLCMDPFFFFYNTIGWYYQWTRTTTVGMFCTNEKKKISILLYILYCGSLLPSLNLSMATDTLAKYDMEKAGTLKGSLPKQNKQKFHTHIDLTSFFVGRLLDDIIQERRQDLNNVVDGVIHLSNAEVSNISTTTKHVFSKNHYLYIDMSTASKTIFQSTLYKIMWGNSGRQHCTPCISRHFKR